MDCCVCKSSRINSSRHWTILVLQPHVYSFNISSYHQFTQQWYWPVFLISFRTHSCWTRHNLEQYLLWKVIEKRVLNPLLRRAITCIWEERLERFSLRKTQRCNMLDQLLRSRHCWKINPLIWIVCLGQLPRTTVPIGQSSWEVAALGRLTAKQMPWPEVSTHCNLEMHSYWSDYIKLSIIWWDCCTFTAKLCKKVSEKQQNQA